MNKPSYNDTLYLSVLSVIGFCIYLDCDMDLFICISSSDLSLIDINYLVLFILKLMLLETKITIDKQNYI